MRHNKLSPIVLLPPILGVAILLSSCISPTTLEVVQPAKAQLGRDQTAVLEVETEVIGSTEDRDFLRERLTVSLEQLGVFERIQQDSEQDEADLALSVTLLDLKKSGLGRTLVSGPVGGAAGRIGVEVIDRKRGQVVSSFNVSFVRSGYTTRQVLNLLAIRAAKFLRDSSSLPS